MSIFPTRPVYKTKAQYCADLVLAFNTATNRVNWRAKMAGTRINPAVHFTSRNSMVVVAYLVNTESFTITFKKTACSWGDFLGAAQRSLNVVLLNLEVSGMGFHAPLDDAKFRIEYNPKTKITSIEFILSEEEQKARSFLPAMVGEYYPLDNEDPDDPEEEYFKDGDEGVENTSENPLDV